MRYYGYYRSSAAYRCRIAFGLKQVAPELLPIHLRRQDQRSASYLAINPQGLVPTLELDDGTYLSQSMAIIEWLDETIPQPPLLPQDPLLRAEIRAFALAIVADIHPINNLRILNYLRSKLGHTQPEIDAWYRHWCEQGLAALEATARHNAQRGAYTFGDTPSLGDICLIPQLANARRFECDLQRYGRLREIEVTCNALPAFEAAASELQPDNETA